MIGGELSTASLSHVYLVSRNGPIWAASSLQCDPIEQREIQVTKTQLVSIALLTLPFACTKPEDDVHPPSDEGPIADDEVSELPPIDPESSPEPLPSGYCLYASDPPREGIWHQCGGSLDIAISGNALGSPIEEDIYVDFGAHVEGDSYEHPRVAACCGEYDYESLRPNRLLIGTTACTTRFSSSASRYPTTSGTWQKRRTRTTTW
jgi:hypothetical protein